MNKTKYVVGLARAGYIEQVVAIIFPEAVIHEDMALAFFGSKNRIIGAGFCHVVEREGFSTAVQAYGDSVSLGIDSRPEDAFYLNAALGLIDDPVPAEIQRKDLDAIHQKISAANAKIGVTQIDADSLPRAANE